MGMKKSTSTAVAAPIAEPIAATAPAAKPVESGVVAATSRLKKATETTAAVKSETKYTGRDFDKEARGKTRCAQFEAALMSPAIAGMKFETVDQYLALCKQAADFGTAYTFGE